MKVLILSFFLTLAKKMQKKQHHMPGISWENHFLDVTESVIYKGVTIYRDAKL